MAMIYHQVVINAASSKVYDALTTQDGLSHWWTADCVVKPEVGFINEFRIGSQVEYRIKVIHLQPGRSVEWKCVNQHDDWSGTQISFSLEDTGNRTRLNFKHQGFASENDAYGASNYQWGRYLAMLKDYCETGNDQVYKDKVLKLVEAVQEARR